MANSIILVTKIFKKLKRRGRKEKGKVYRDGGSFKMKPDIPLPLQEMTHFFEHIMIRQEQDIPNWILDESGRFTLKSA